MTFRSLITLSWFFFCLDNCPYFISFFRDMMRQMVKHMRAGREWKAASQDGSNAINFLFLVHFTLHIRRKLTIRKNQEPNCKPEYCSHCFDYRDFSVVWLRTKHGCHSDPSRFGQSAEMHATIGLNRFLVRKTLPISDNLVYNIVPEYNAVL